MYFKLHQLTDIYKYNLQIFLPVIKTIWEWFYNRFNTKGLLVFSAAYIKSEVNHDVLY